MAINLTLPFVPSEGGTLIAVVAVNDSGGAADVTGITQTGATWVEAVRENDGDNLVAIWYAEAAGGADVDITITTVSDETEAAVVVEYSGLRSLSGTPLDQTASDTGSSATADTGLTPETINVNELLVGGFQVRGGSTVSAPTNSFAIADQESTGAAGTDITAALVDRIVTGLVLQADSQVTIDSGSTTWSGAIATFFGLLIQVASVNPTLVSKDGGTELVITGNFRESETYNVHVGPNGDSTDPLCYAGQGLGTSVTPITATEMRCFLPELPVGTVLSVFIVEEGDATQSDDLANAITVIEPGYSTSLFQLRRLFAPNRKIGPRKMDLLPAVARPQQRLLQSGDLTVSPWSTLSASVVGTEEDPFDGTAGHILHEDATAAAAHAVQQSGLTTAAVLGDVYVLSVYAKAINRDFITLDGGIGGSTFFTQVFDLAQGALGVVSDAGSVILESRITPVDIVTGWYLLEVEFRSDQNGSLDFGCVLRDSDTINPLFNGLDQDSVRLAFPVVDRYPLFRGFRVTTTAELLT